MLFKAFGVYWSLSKKTSRPLHPLDNIAPIPVAPAILRKLLLLIPIVYKMLLSEVVICNYLLNVEFNLDAESLSKNKTVLSCFRKIVAGQSVEISPFNVL